MDDNKKEMSDILRFLSNRGQHYLTGRQDVICEPVEPLESKDSILFRVDEITFEEEAPWKQALENVLSAVRIPGINFLYCIMGDEKGVQFYYGLARDVTSDSGIWVRDLEIPEYGQSVLAASLTGNYRGSKISAVSPAEKNKIFSRIKVFADGWNPCVSRIEGVAGSGKDDERFQSVDRLIDVMQGDPFCVLIVARPVHPDAVGELEQILYDAYSAIIPDVTYKEHRSKTEGDDHASNSYREEGKGYVRNTTKNHTEANRNTEEQFTRENREKPTNSSGSTDSAGSNKVKNTEINQSDQKREDKSENWTERKTVQERKSQGESKTFSWEYQNKYPEEWVKYCDNVLFHRLDYGRGKGIFHSAFYVMSDSLKVQSKLENTVLALYSGKEGNQVPLRALRLKKDDPQRRCITGLQVPSVHFQKRCQQEEIWGRALLSQCIPQTGSFPLSSWMTTNELSMIAGLPRKEVVGLKLREEVEFGLNVDSLDPKDSISLGKLVKDGNILDKTPVKISRNALDKHLFVAGVTGSGKTTTCQRILLESGLPYMVIEPAKTEYRILRNLTSAGIEPPIIFTLGDDVTAPFRFNPLEFQREESISSHVDMVKASIEAAFDMEAAIPQLIESILYYCYEECGWDISTNSNSRFEDPFAPGVFSFPTLEDVLKNIEAVVAEQGFDDRLKNDYIGSIKARLQSLVLGSKGDMLNTKRSIDFDTLLDKNVILELEGIKNGDEKSLIMGFILGAFNEAVRERYMRTGEKHPHILLVEEAHRLLSKYQPGDSPNKKQGVATFTDMLAEIRKYGECLIIADQIPNKLAEDVLKNTNTKIVHRIFAQDDKEAIGNTMALNNDQKRFLSNLNVGRAVVFSDGFGQAVQVQIERRTDTSGSPIKNAELEKSAVALDYYYNVNPPGVLFRLKKPIGDLQGAIRKTAAEFVRLDIPCKLCCLAKNKAKNKRWSDHYYERLSLVLKENLTTKDALVEWIYARCFANGKYSIQEESLREKILFLLDAYERKNKEEIKNISWN